MVNSNKGFIFFLFFDASVENYIPFLHYLKEGFIYIYIFLLHIYPLDVSVSIVLFLDGLTDDMKKIGSIF